MLPFPLQCTPLPTTLAIPFPFSWTTLLNPWGYPVIPTFHPPPPPVYPVIFPPSLFHNSKDWLMFSSVISKAVCFAGYWFCPAKYGIAKHSWRTTNGFSDFTRPLKAQYKFAPKTATQCSHHLYLASIIRVTWQRCQSQWAKRTTKKSEDVASSE